MSEHSSKRSRQISEADYRREPPTDIDTLSQGDKSQPWARAIRTDCPRCRYDLTGLTIGSNCPECGITIGTVSDQELPSSGFATAALVFGILAFPGCVAMAIPTFVCGILSVAFWLVTAQEVKKGHCSASSLATARAGAACGITAMVLVGAFLLLIL